VPPAGKAGRWISSLAFPIALSRILIIAPNPLYKASFQWALRFNRLALTIRIENAVFSLESCVSLGRIQSGIRDNSYLKSGHFLQQTDILRFFLGFAISIFYPTKYFSTRLNRILLGFHLEEGERSVLRWSLRERAPTRLGLKGINQPGKWKLLFYKPQHHFNAAQKR
jgi:hypothetical protein